MTAEERALGAVFKAVDEVNQLLPKEQRLEKSIDTVLLDNQGRLDSLGLVNLIVAIEQQIENEFGVSIALTNEILIFQNNSSPRTIGALAADIALLLEEKANG